MKNIKVVFGSGWYLYGVVFKLPMMAGANIPVGGWRSCLFIQFKITK